MSPPEEATKLLDELDVIKYVKSDKIHKKLIAPHCKYSSSGTDTHRGQCESVHNSCAHSVLYIVCNSRVVCIQIVNVKREIFSQCSSGRLETLSSHFCWLTEWRRDAIHLFFIFLLDSCYWAVAFVNDRECSMLSVAFTNSIRIHFTKSAPSTQST